MKSSPPIPPINDRDVPEVAEIDRQVVTIPAADRQEFDAWANGPAKDVPALRTLATSLPVWQDAARQKIAAGVASLHAGHGVDGEGFMAALDTDLADKERQG